MEHESGRQMGSFAPLAYTSFPHSLNKAMLNFILFFHFKKKFGEISLQFIFIQIKVSSVCIFFLLNFK